MEYFCHKSRGRLFIADPRAKDRGNRKFWLLMRCDPGIVNLYSWLAIRNGWEILKGSRWGPHVSVVCGERPKGRKLWDSLNGRTCWYNYSVNTRNDNEFVWLDVQSDDLEQIREDLGLRRKPYFSFHLTVGRLKFCPNVKVG